MSFGKTIKLSNGALMPRIGLGTWQSKPKEVENAVSIVSLSSYMSTLLTVVGNIRLRSPFGMDIVTLISL